MPNAIPAAGTIPWRVSGGALEVALVHRPRYRDWSWPKGKLDAGEEWPVAAVRETWEETGLTARLGIPLPDATYMVMSRSGKPDEKRVRYWAASVHGKPATLANEVDEVAWLPVDQAHERLDYARDRDQLLAVAQAHAHGVLDSWPLVIVRHARAVSRSEWSGSNDQRRPLDDRGTQRAATLGPLLAAYGVSSLVSSPSVRCVDTVVPHAATSGARLVTKAGLSEEGFAADPSKIDKHLTKLWAAARPTALCTHGPVLPTLLDRLKGRVDRELIGHEEVLALLDEARSEHLVKGEALVCHVVGRGDDASIVAAERHLP